jgi:hypothetical protein
VGCLPRPYSCLSTLSCKTPPIPRFSEAHGGTFTHALLMHPLGMTGPAQRLQTADMRANEASGSPPRGY